MSFVNRNRSSSMFLSLVLALMVLTLGVRGSGASIGRGQVENQSITAMPFLIVQPDGPGSVKVRGQGFTPNGDVYLAIYDQMGKQLYENRWVKASPRLSDYEADVRRYVTERGEFLLSGLINETFGGLCGASALIRGLDYETNSWSNWQIVQPACAAGTVPPLAANPQNGPFLHNAVLDPPVSTQANGLNIAAPPVLQSVQSASIEGMIVVTGKGFSDGGHVYIAIYAQMGDELFETRWVKSFVTQNNDGPRADVPEADRGSLVTGGALYQTFFGLCGESVMVRAYDDQTGVWTNWLEIAPTCAAISSYGPQ